MSRRVYVLDQIDGRKLSEEEIAVTFAKTSRSPEPFDQIAQQVDAEKSAQFHEKWVVGYGHSSVAEHAVLHVAVEEISRLACDMLEDNRLGSYTEKSSRYQVMQQDDFYVPEDFEQAGEQELRVFFGDTCRRMFQCYQELTEQCIEYLMKKDLRGKEESEGAYKGRLRRRAIEECRSVLPAATLTNVGVTMNARSMEYAITKLLSSPLDEMRSLGYELYEAGMKSVPTLIKYAQRSSFLVQLDQVRAEMVKKVGVVSQNFKLSGKSVSHDRFFAVMEMQVGEVLDQLLAAFLCHRSAVVWWEALVYLRKLSLVEKGEMLRGFMGGIGPHDPVPREFELVDFLVEMMMDYGAYREFKRHRMQSYLPKMLHVKYGYRLPPLLEEAGLADLYQPMMAEAAWAHEELSKFSPEVAQYVVPHGCLMWVLTKVNLRELFHLFQLRTSKQAHLAIMGPIGSVMKRMVELYPTVFQYLVLRDYPDWWESVVGGDK